MCSSLSDSAAVPRGKETRSDCDSIHRNSAFLAQDSGVDARHADPAGLGRIDGLLGGVPGCGSTGSCWIVIHSGYWLRVLHNALPGMRQGITRPDWTDALPTMSLLRQSIRRRIFRTAAGLCDRSPAARAAFRKSPRNAAALLRLWRTGCAARNP